MLKSTISKIEFEGETPQIITFLSKPDEVRIVIETGKHQWANVAPLGVLPRGRYKITVEPIELEQ